MLFLIDSNVLISSYDVTEQQHKLSYLLLQQAMKGQMKGALAHQNLLEYVAVVTDSRRVEHPLSLREAFLNIDIYTASLTLIYPKVTTVSTLQDLSKAKSAPRMKIFDLYLAATALDNGITQICTWNIADFMGIPKIEAVSPEELLDRVSDGG